MARWRIELRKSEIDRWTAYLISFAIYYLVAVVIGWHLHPRWDELLFVASIPLWVIVPYAVFSLLIGVFRMLWTIWRHHPRSGIVGGNRRHLPRWWSGSSFTKSGS